MKSIVSGITYFFMGCSVILLVIMVFFLFNEQVIKKLRDESPQIKTENEETNEPEDKPPADDDNGGYETPTGSVNVRLEDAIIYSGKFELPIDGATGYASVIVEVYDGDYNLLTTLKPGQAFRILKEDGTWWKIYFKTETETEVVGWLKHNLCMINLPDIIPSIIYDNTNAYGSVFTANEMPIEGITGQRLYSYSENKDGRLYNERLGRNEYIVPVLYAMAERICAAQRNALKNDDTLVIYEGFRPFETQNKVYGEVLKLPSGQKNFGSYSMSAFIAYGISNHQMGYAIDTSLGNIIGTDYIVTGKYKYPKYNYIEHIMPCQIHELSVKATLANAKNNKYAQNLQKYCKDAGLSPLSSEWWHFNDETANAGIPGGKRSDGKYFITELYSISPGE